jgi:hypothetical protein
LLFERRVDPRGTAEDRHLFSFDATLQFTTPATIRMRRRAPSGAERWLACWSGIEVE